jgi:hypothetical protein
MNFFPLCVRSWKALRYSYRPTAQCAIFGAFTGNQPLRPQKDSGCAATRPRKRYVRVR